MGTLLGFLIRQAVDESIGKYIAFVQEVNALGEAGRNSLRNRFPVTFRLDAWPTDATIDDEPLTRTSGTALAQFLV